MENILIANNITYYLINLTSMHDMQLPTKHKHHTSTNTQTL